MLSLSLKRKVNDDEPAAIFSRQVAAWVPDKFWKFYFIKKITKLLITKQPFKLEKKSTQMWNSENFRKTIDVGFAKLKKNPCEN